MKEPDKFKREVLPIPTDSMGQTTYDAKDPETKFPPSDTAGGRANIRTS
jgi:hypothetical protein